MRNFPSLSMFQSQIAHPAAVRFVFRRGSLGTEYLRPHLRIPTQRQSRRSWGW